MSQSPLESLIATGTKLWLDSIDPDLVRSNFELGATGATSNPIIVGNLLKSGRFDSDIRNLADQGLDDEAIAWEMTDKLVSEAQQTFRTIWEETAGNDGYVSFELDPLIEDPNTELPHDERVQRYIELGKKWFSGKGNRMIKVPATPAGIEALEPLAAHGVALNVTLIFTERQYASARDSVWRGAQQRTNLDTFKSAYSVFVSRVDAYTSKHVSELSEEAQGQVGIVNAKRIWQANQDFWQLNSTPLQQEIIFASTGTKNPSDSPGKYVMAFAGSDIETNPPATNDAVQASGQLATPQISSLPNDRVLTEIDAKVEFTKLESVLMEEGIQKFADPQKALLELIRSMRASIV